MMSPEEATQLAFDLMNKIERDDDGNPLTLEGAIRHTILKWPGMNTHRNHVLNTLYCILGSGLEWRNGRIIDRCANSTLAMPPGPGQNLGVFSEEHGFDESMEQMKKGASKEFIAILDDVEDKLRLDRRHRVNEAIETIKDIDNRCRDYSDDVANGDWYPLSWYGCNLAAPGDAQEDFFMGAIETVNLVINSRPQRGTQEWIDHRRTVRYAEQIFETLLARCTSA